MPDADPHERLIESLAAGLRPVRPLWTPWLRALVWLVGAILLAVAVTFPTGAGRLIERLGDGTGEQVELAAAVLTAVASALAACALAIPGRSPRWALMPLPPLLIWLTATGWSCYETVATGQGDAGPSPFGCFRFILGASLPLTVLLYLMMRRGFCVHLALAATLAGLASGTAAAVLLDLHHPDTLTFPDLFAHLGAVTLVVTASRLLLPKLLRA